MQQTEVILVDENDNEIGRMEKVEAHEKAALHRAFSVFIFNGKGEMLLQQRAFDKYHSGGLWSNACCSHPRPGEETRAAAERRLKEELGFETGLEKIDEFVYRAEFENGLTEFEYDHIFVGEYDGPIALDKDEVDKVVYETVGNIESDLNNRPEEYTVWFQLIFPRVRDWWAGRYPKRIKE